MASRAKRKRRFKDTLHQLKQKFLGQGKTPRGPDGYVDIPATLKRLRDQDWVNDPSMTYEEKRSFLLKYRQMVDARMAEGKRYVKMIREMERLTDDALDYGKKLDGLIENLLSDLEKARKTP